jgi:hypothetical protein
VKEDERSKTESRQVETVNAFIVLVENTLRG